MDTIHTTTLKTLECANCAMPFAMSARFMQERREDHTTFYCPAGHRNHYPGKSDAEKLQDKLDAAERSKTYLRSRVDQAEAEAAHQRSRAAGYKGSAAKLKKRIGKGVCPGCNRHFVNVERHMSTQHPDPCAPAPTSGER